MIVSFKSRNFSQRVNFAGLVFEVKRMEWDIDGGPARAIVEARWAAGWSAGLTGRESLNISIARMFQLLRCECVISQDYGGPVWWGFVNALRAGGLRFSLDGMTNKVAVRYRDERPTDGGETAGWQYQTGWVTDSYSVLEYGTKEYIGSMQEATASEAAALATQILSDRRRVSLEAAGSDEESNVAVIELAGWWSTLGWRYFSESRGREGFSGGGSSQPIGNVTGTQWAAQSFQLATTWAISSLWLKVGRFGSPTDNLNVGFQTNSGGIPSGSGAGPSVVGVAGSGMLTDIGWYKCDLAAAWTPTAATLYWIVLSRSGSLSATDYYRASVDEGGAYGAGSCVFNNGSTWAARSPVGDIPFMLIGLDLTTNQILNMADPAGTGQFFSSVVIKNASTVNARRYRAGFNTALEDIREMLAMGDGSGGRLMAQVTEGRGLVVESVPAATAAPELLILSGGTVARRDGGIMPVGSRLVGKWARVQGIDSLSGDAAPIGNVLIRRAVWDGGRVRVAWNGG
jgi:hypothetical protein